MASIVIVTLLLSKMVSFSRFWLVGAADMLDVIDDVGVVGVVVAVVGVIADNLPLCVDEPPK